MAGYDPQRDRRRPQAAETGAAPVDGLLGSAPPVSAVPAAPTLDPPTVTPPPPVPDPDPRLVTAAVAAGLVSVVVGGVLIRRWRRRR
ncbi:MAG: hypothetical protein ACR2QE_01955 [Acidimicrobiales bacterium]